jgi:hypothetical protein
LFINGNKKAHHAKVKHNTLKIAKKYHELLAFLNKILITIPNRYKPVSTSKTLKYYKDSLHNFLTINLLNYIR